MAGNLRGSEIAARGLDGSLSAWVVLAGIVSVLTLVWLVLWLGNDRTPIGSSSSDEMILIGRVGPSAAPAAAAEPAWLGIDVQPVDALLARHLGLPDRRGVVVSWVHPGSPAALAGLAQGDVIRRIGATRVRNVDQLAGLLAGGQPGESLQAIVWHAGAQTRLRITLARRPPPQARFQTPLPEAEVEVEAAWLGLDILPLTAAEARELGLPASTRGMMVDGVAPGPGVDAGFQAGDVIIAVNGQATPTTADFAEATEGAVGAVVDVLRAGQHVYISVPPPSAVQGGGRALGRQVSFGLW